MLDAGELPGWVQGMMDHETLQMIHNRYYCHIKNYERDDGSAFIEKVYNACLKPGERRPESVVESKKLDPNLTQAIKTGNQAVGPTPRYSPLA
jgi:hypothetical protein